MEMTKSQKTRMVSTGLACQVCMPWLRGGRPLGGLWSMHDAVYAVMQRLGRCAPSVWCCVSIWACNELAGPLAAEKHMLHRLVPSGRSCLSAALQAKALHLSQGPMACNYEQPVQGIILQQEFHCHSKRPLCCAGSSESEDYDDSISEDDDDEFEPERARSHVLIEDVTDLPATHLPVSRLSPEA